MPSKKKREVLEELRAAMEARADAFEELHQISVGSLARDEARAHRLFERANEDLAEALTLLPTKAARSAALWAFAEQLNAQAAAIHNDGLPPEETNTTMLQLQRDAWEQEAES